MATTNNKRKNKEISDLKKIAFYSSMPFMMAVIIGLGAWGGIELDKKFNLEYPVFTILLTILAVILAIYYFVKDLINFKK